jgi:Tol biopolymer transport system component
MTLVRVDPSGREQQLLPRTGTLSQPSVSPTGSQIALTASPRGGGGVPDIWLLDIGSSAFTRLTTDSANQRPEWTRDGKQVLYINRTRRDSTVLRAVSADGSGSSVVLRTGRPSVGDAVNEVSPGPADGYTIYRTGGGDPGMPSANLHISRTSDPANLQVYLGTPASELTPHLSPSGRSVVYATDQTGRSEVYLRPVPGPGGATPVSINGGIEPLWSRDGKTVFYRTPDRHIMAATIDEAGQRVLSRRPLFRDIYLTATTNHNYDVFPNGDFVFVSGALSDSRVAVTTDWKRLFERRLAGQDKR